MAILYHGFVIGTVAVVNPTNYAPVDTRKIDAVSDAPVLIGRALPPDAGACLIVDGWHPANKTHKNEVDL